MKVKIKKTHPNARIPEYKTAGSAGFDLEILDHLGGGIETKYEIAPGDQHNFRTGLAFEIPEGYELQIRSRSGLGINKGLIVTHGVGTIDSDYRGEVILCIRNVSNCPWTLEKGDRISQAILAPIVQAEFEEVEELSSTDRGDGGFGSTG